MERRHGQGRRGRPAHVCQAECQAGHCGGAAGAVRPWSPARRDPAGPPAWPGPRCRDPRGLPTTDPAHRIRHPPLTCIAVPSQGGTGWGLRACSILRLTLVPGRFCDRAGMSGGRAAIAQRRPAGPPLTGLAGSGSLGWRGKPVGEVSMFAVGGGGWGGFGWCLTSRGSEPQCWTGWQIEVGRPCLPWCSDLGVVVRSHDDGWGRPSPRAVTPARQERGRSNYPGRPVTGFLPCRNLGDGLTVAL